MQEPPEDREPVEQGSKSPQPDHDRGPRRVTAEELEARYDRWSAAWTPARRSTARRMSVVVVSALVIVAALAVGHHDHAGSQTRLAVVSESARVLSSQAAVSPSAVASTSMDPARISALVSDARTTAAQVASAQSRFQSLAHAADRSTSSGNGAPDAAAMAMINHRKDLAAWWSPSSLVLSTAEAYSFSTQPDLDVTHIDPRTPWFIAHDGSRVAGPHASRWAVAAVGPHSGSQTNADVTWVCSGTGTTVYAWATATYSSSTGRFSGLSVTYSSAGVRASGDPVTQTSVVPIAPGSPSPSDPRLHNNKVPGYNIAPTPTATSPSVRSGSSPSAQEAHR